ncbi:MAG: hypothetical protein QNJ51_24590 [Calothrix sp. MO_167.B12]|nr:hypothetical protein [Calothrix sp. MO_167.B12]
MSIAIDVLDVLAVPSIGLITAGTGGKTSVNSGITVATIPYLT